jgi:gliding motility-associated lipoprotein GldH
MAKTKIFSLMLLAGLLIIGGCKKIDLYEKTVALPAHEWKSSYKPSFEFAIEDSTRPYELFFVCRHSDKYSFNNIIFKVSLTDPLGKTFSFESEKQLGNNDQGWLGVGMDDIYEHRISLNKELIAAGFSFKNKGTYSISLEQLMRENPLKQVFNVGLRLERKN